MKKVAAILLVSFITILLISCSNNGKISASVNTPTLEADIATSTGISNDENLVSVRKVGDNLFSVIVRDYENNATSFANVCSSAVTALKSSQELHKVSFDELKVIGHGIEWTTSNLVSGLLKNDAGNIHAESYTIEDIANYLSTYSEDDSFRLPDTREKTTVIGSSTMEIPAGSTLQNHQSGYPEEEVTIELISKNNTIIGHINITKNIDMGKDRVMFWDSFWNELSSTFNYESYRFEPLSLSNQMSGSICYIDDLVKSDKIQIAVVYTEVYSLTLLFTYDNRCDISVDSTLIDLINSIDRDSDSAAS